MDLDLLYRDFFVNDRELLFHSVPGTVPSFHDEEGNMYCTVPVFQHPDPDHACDLLSTNHRLPETADLAKFGTMVVAGSSTDHIKVLIPDTVGPTVDADSPVVLQHVVGLSFGPAVDLSSSLPPTDLALALCDNSVLPTLTRRRRAYWAEINPILQKWQNINDARCPACDRLIRVNMSRHLRLSHTFCQCFWRCPVPSCPMWFASELNGKDHLEWPWLLLLRLPAPIWIGVVWPAVILRPKGYNRSSFMDGPRTHTEIRSGTP